MPDGFCAGYFAGMLTMVVFIGGFAAALWLIRTGKIELHSGAQEGK